MYWTLIFPLWQSPNLDLFDTGKGLKVQTATPHLVSLGSGRLSVAITLLPLKEGNTHAVWPPPLGLPTHCLISMVNRDLCGGWCDKGKWYSMPGHNKVKTRSHTWRTESPYLHKTLNPHPWLFLFIFTGKENYPTYWLLHSLNPQLTIPKWWHHTTLTDYNSKQIQNSYDSHYMVSWQWFIHRGEAPTLINWKTEIHNIHLLLK